MLIKPRLEDHKIVGFYLGTVLVGLGAAMGIPLLTALCFREWNPLLDYSLSGAITLSLGFALRLSCFTKKEIGWLHGLTVAALSWLVAALMAALPLYFSGGFGSYLDALFEAMNALATAGFSLVRDLDHLAVAHNMWRHLLMLLGGQGIVVIALSMLVRAGAGGFKLYAGEGRDERILPNILHTARFICLISSLFLVLGTAVLALILWSEGLPPVKALLHGLWLFMAGFHTGGFTPQTQSILYYHSWRLELALLGLIILGIFNFHLHYAVLSGDKKELRRNIELNIFFLSVLLGAFLVFWALIQRQVYPGLLAMFRKGSFLLISAHTSTGYTTLYPAQLFREWGQLALLALMTAMSLGGSVCSTAGGIKILRLGLIGKALRQDVQRLLLPDNAVLAEKYHHIKDAFLNDKIVRGAALITLLYLAVFLLGAVAGVCYGYPFFAALFESISATSNTGLSCGIINPALPAGLKIIYLLQIWAGRLEFIAIFGLLAYGWSCWRGK
ncbi:MAG: TrkH family potassium uptake protein [Candidatus Margulisbacteria bacterium]|jgi:trk system potassium uptake protein TrkH|nr:TrkH family potassium uptake protein [Candidatus Margulisiibacteriota bacterium]